MSNKTTGLSTADLVRLREPFLDEEIQVKAGKTVEFGNWCPMIVYVSHPAVKNRLEEIDPNYTSELIEAVSGTVYDKFQKKDVSKISVILAITLKGITRVNVGDGSDYLEAFSIAYRRAGEAFGIGRYLYDVPERVMIVWTKDVKFQKPLTMAMVRQLEKKKVEVNGKSVSAAWVKKNVMDALPDLGKQSGKKTEKKSSKSTSTKEKKTESNESAIKKEWLSNMSFNYNEILKYTGEHDSFFAVLAEHEVENPRDKGITTQQMIEISQDFKTLLTKLKKENK